MLTNANHACFWLRVWWPTWFIGLEFPHFPSFSYPNAECYEGFGENYQGDQSRTRSNLPCAPWRDHHSRLAHCVPASFWPYNFAKLCLDVQNRHAPLCQTADEHLSLKQRLRSPQFSAMSLILVRGVFFGAAKREKRKPPKEIEQKICKRQGCLFFSQARTWQH